MQKCKLCEWEFSDDIRICPYCGHPVEPEDKKQKRRFNQQGRPNLPGGVKQPLPGPRPSQPTPSSSSKKPIQLAILVSALIVALVLSGILLVRANRADQSLTVSPSVLDFGQVRAGSKSVLPVVIMKSNESPLNWQIAPANVQWLQIALRPKAGQSSNLEDIYNVTANTGKLKVGKYSARLLFSSERGNTQQVTVKIQVVKTNTPAKLNVSPLSLDFGSPQVGNRETRQLTVSNSGGQELRWTVDRGKTPWLTLDHYSGKIAAGAIPQNINVMVDTATLSARQYQTTINFISNGGKASITVNLKVTGPPTGITVTPTPTPTQTTVQRQISSTQMQSQTTDATGSGESKATNAKGTLTFINPDYSAHTYAAGTTYVSKSGVPVAIDVDANVPAGSPAGPSSTKVPAHAMKPGAVGNIAADDVDTYVDPDSHAFVKNEAAFTGGQDAQTYTFVLQSDIDGIATSLKASTQQSAINDIHQQLHPNEHLVGDPRCTPNVSSDHNAGDIASQVTVNVTTTCKAIAST